MVSRYAIPDSDLVQSALRAHACGYGAFAARYNAAPSSLVPVIRSGGATAPLQVAEARWGFIADWWKEPMPPRLAATACAENASSVPRWGVSYRTSRCLLPALGWYEWCDGERTDAGWDQFGGSRQPRFFQLPGGATFFMGGLLSLWTPPGRPPLLTCAILTRASNAAGSERIPVIIRPEDHERWLDDRLVAALGIHAIVDRALGDELDGFAVSTLVNSEINEGPELMEAIHMWPYPRTGTVEARRRRAAPLG